MANLQRLANFILQEVPGYPRVSEKYPTGMSATDSAEEAIKEYQWIAQQLWKLLDDISTLDDAAKGDDAGFRKRAYELAASTTSPRDTFREWPTPSRSPPGYRLFKGNFPDPEPER